MTALDLVDALFRHPTTDQRLRQQWEGLVFYLRAVTGSPPDALLAIVLDRLATRLPSPSPIPPSP